MSTYSTNLGITLIGTGEEDGTWGAVTNTNLGTLLEQAISGYVTQAVATGTDTIITIPDGATGVARNMFIELTGTGGASTNVIVPAKKKLYFVYNNTTGAVVVKVSGQTGVSIPNGAKIALVCDGTDVRVATNYMASTTLGSALPVSSGGTGVTGTPTNGQLLIGNGSGYTLANLTAGTGCTINNTAGGITINATGSGGSVTSVTGTGTVNGITLSGVVNTAGNLTLGGALTGVSLTSQVTGTLPAANGGTGVASPGANGNVLTSNGTTWVSSPLPGGGSVTSVGMSGGSTGLTVSGSPITTSGTMTLGGTLAVASGGTGATTATGARTNLNVPSSTGAGASGTWDISITGSAAYASSAGNGGVTSVNGLSGAVTVSSGVGVGQSWQDVTSSRASGVTYTNNTGKPILVSIWASGDSVMFFYVNGSFVGGARSSGPYLSGNGNTFIVPNGATYSVTGANMTWNELR